MKKTRLLWILVIALIIPTFATSCDLINSLKDKVTSSKEKTEKTEESKEKPQPTIEGKYNLDKESTLALIGEEAFNDPDITEYNLKSEFNFNKDDSLAIRLLCRLSIFSSDINNTIILKFLIKCHGTWGYDKESKKLTLNVDKSQIGECDLKFDHEDRYTQMLRKQYGSDAALAQVIKQQIKIDDMAKDATGSQTVKEITDNGFTIEENGKTIEFKKAK